MPGTGFSARSFKASLKAYGRLHVGVPEGEVINFAGAVNLSQPFSFFKHFTDPGSVAQE